jgi:hypothetical protein
MTVPSNYTSQIPDIGVNTYSKPVNNAAIEAAGTLGGLAGAYVKNREAKQTADYLGGIQENVTKAEYDFTHNLTPSEQEAVKVAQIQGQIDTDPQNVNPTDVAYLNNIKAQGSRGDAMVAQGRASILSHKLKMEELRRNVYKDRPDLIDKADKIFENILGFNPLGARWDAQLEQQKQLEASLKDGAEASNKKVTDDWTAIDAAADSIAPALTPSQKNELNGQIASARMNPNPVEGAEQARAFMSKITGIPEAANASWTKVHSENQKAIAEVQATASSAIQKLQDDPSARAALYSDTPAQVFYENIDKSISKLNAVVTSYAGQPKVFGDMADVEVQKAQQMVGLLTDLRKAASGTEREKTLRAMDFLAQSKADPNAVSLVGSAIQALGGSATDATVAGTSAAHSVVSGKTLMEGAWNGTAKLSAATRGYPNQLNQTIPGQLVRSLEVEKIGAVKAQDTVRTLSWLVADANIPYVVNGVEQTLPQNKIFETGSAVEYMTSPTFTKDSQSYKTIMGMAPNNRLALAMSLALPLDRLATRASVEAQKDDPSLEVRPTSYTRMLEAIKYDPDKVRELKTKLDAHKTPYVATPKLNDKVWSHVEDKARATKLRDLIFELLDY